ncbi:MAG: acyl-CoA thioesterase [Bacillaceae bacterium]|nr:acyl-CoA thioesterase [Bacillaceae bacterium]
MAHISETTVKVRYQETDQMGVVYHANYLVWFEVGRTHFIRELGIPYSVLEQKNILLPVLEANCKYKIPARYEDELVVRTRLAELSPARLRFDYDIYRPADDRVLSEGYTLHAFVNREMKPYNIKKYAPDLFERLQKSVSSDDK